MKKQLLLAACVSAMTMAGFSGIEIAAEQNEIPTFGWNEENGKQYWYENSVKQGTYEDANGVMGDGTIRGREIYDPVSDGWYWLDAVYNGAKAVNKEVWMPYIYQNEAEWGAEEIAQNASNSGDMKDQVIREINNKSGKWVRYDENGKMYKGWYTVEGADAEIYPSQAGNTYYYDPMTGLMAKGEVTIDGKTYRFDKVTGVLSKAVAEDELREGETVLDSGVHEGGHWAVTNQGRLLLSGDCFEELTFDRRSLQSEHCGLSVYGHSGHVYESAPWQKYGKDIVEVKADMKEFFASDFFNKLNNIEVLDLSGCEKVDMNLAGFTNKYHPCPNLKYVNLSGTTLVSEQKMFENCKNLVEVDLSNATISEYMGWMFSGCTNLTKVNLKGVDTSEVTDMAYMFADCTSLTELDLTDLDTGNVKNMYCMFKDCIGLETLDLNNFDMRNAKLITDMFIRCSNLKELKVSNFNTEKVTDPRGMFEGCSSLTELDLASFDMRNAVSAVVMFRDCTNLKTIYVGENWQIPSDCHTDGMFENCGTDTVTYR